jgi:hypothetical protein
MCTSVGLSVRMELGRRLMDFYEIWYLGIFRKLVEKIQVSMKSDKNNWYLYEDQYYFYRHLVHFISEWEMFQARSVEGIRHAFYFQ